jgi:hypothetical protein
MAELGGEFLQALGDAMEDLGLAGFLLRADLSVGSLAGVDVEGK